MQNVVEDDLLEDCKLVMFKKHSLLEKDLFKIKVTERRLQVRMINSFKEIAKMQPMALLTPVYDKEKKTVTVESGSDL
jgi:hypothetical protein